MDHFVGIDVSLESCVVNRSGATVREAKVSCEPEALIAFLRDLDHNLACVGLEAGPLSQWLHRHLRDTGLEAVLMETRQVKGALKAMPIKTDRRDAVGIAQLIRMGWFRPVHRKSVSTQELRALLGARRTLQKSMISIELSMRACCAGSGSSSGGSAAGSCRTAPANWQAATRC
ncbi:transposase [Salipiger aestuarii]|uniref:Transposase n=1 Tax=Salipiger aestuarii TaxID=568098 RepID=A0A327YLD2_9RHOB|nr:transposase [Salipiger aestuarii]